MLPRVPTFWQMVDACILYPLLSCCSSVGEVATAERLVSSSPVTIGVPCSIVLSHTAVLMLGNPVANCRELVSFFLAQWVRRPDFGSDDTAAEWSGYRCGCLGSPCLGLKFGLSPCFWGSLLLWSSSSLLRKQGRSPIPCPRWCEEPCAVLSLAHSKCWRNVSSDGDEEEEELVPAPWAGHSVFISSSHCFLVKGGGLTMTVKGPSS